jgi:acyl-CoA thioesterase-2
MSEPLLALIEALKLERLEENLFRGAVTDTLIKRVYGGKVLGEAMKAAQSTVDSNRTVHSMHGYFLREADSHNPIIYEVDRSRDGRSFSARRVTAIQYGLPVFTLEASFHIPEDGLEYQRPLPDVPPPEDIAPMTYDPERIANLPARYQRMFKIMLPFDVRPIDGPLGGHDAEGNPLRRVWVKTVAPLPDDYTLHRAILAYLSDFGLVWTVIGHHGFTLQNENISVASLDHAMWFHRPFRMDEWLLYHCEGVSTSASRGLARGSFYRRSGELVVSATQEGLMRVHGT